MKQRDQQHAARRSWNQYGNSGSLDVALLTEPGAPRNTRAVDLFPPPSHQRVKPRRAFFGPPEISCAVGQVRSLLWAPPWGCRAGGLCSAQEAPEGPRRPQKTWGVWLSHHALKSHSSGPVSLFQLAPGPSPWTPGLRPLLAPPLCLGAQAGASLAREVPDRDRRGWWCARKRGSGRPLVSCKIAAP